MSSDRLMSIKFLNIWSGYKPVGFIRETKVVLGNRKTVEP